jgi:hypothetical protein
MAVGNAITRLHRDRYGRGATTTRTVFQGNRIIAFLEDIYAPFERTLIGAGDWEQAPSCLSRIATQTCAPRSSSSARTATGLGQRSRRTMFGPALRPDEKPA